jgi:hypothetical protein
VDQEIPGMLVDAVIGTAVSSMMETAFQPNNNQKLFNVQSEYGIIKNELNEFHTKVDMDSYVLTAGFNILVYGNLLAPLYYDEDGRMQLLSLEPDYTSVTPVIVSNRILGFMKGAEFLEPYNYAPGQLLYYKDLGGTRSANANTLTQDSEFKNECQPAPS